MKKFKLVILSKALVLLLVVICLTACKSNPIEVAPVVLEKSPVRGELRNFSMGFSAIPKSNSDQAYLRSYDFAANYGETLLIRSAPSWHEFLGENVPSAEYIERILAQKHALESRDLNLIYVLDVFDPLDRAILFNIPSEHYELPLTSKK